MHYPIQLINSIQMYKQYSDKQDYKHYNKDVWGTQV